MTRNQRDTEIEKDERLAAYTDALLNSQAEPGGRISADLSAHPEEGQGEVEALAKVVKTLAQALSPHPPPDHLRLKIRRRVIAAWEQDRPAQKRRFLNLFRRPAQRWAWAAVAASVLIVAAVALLLPHIPLETSGTASGEVGVFALVAFVAMAVVLAVALFIGRRR